MNEIGVLHLDCASNPGGHPPGFAYPAYFYITNINRVHEISTIHEHF
ncbi:Hypothetical protein BIBO2_2683 [Brucella sp. BO2]|nr:Hypothetical protein BIBO2_2683 [Brucella sp. BO2]